MLGRVSISHKIMLKLIIQVAGSNDGKSSGICDATVFYDNDIIHAADIETLWNSFRSKVVEREVYGSLEKLCVERGFDAVKLLGK
jgi:hypothetical protein